MPILKEKAASREGEMLDLSKPPERLAVTFNIEEEILDKIGRRVLLLKHLRRLSWLRILIFASKLKSREGNGKLRKD